MKNKLSPNLTKEGNKIRTEIDEIEAVKTTEKSMKLRVSCLKR